MPVRENHYGEVAKAKLRQLYSGTSNQQIIEEAQVYALLEIAAAIDRQGSNTVHIQDGEWKEVDNRDEY